MSNNKEAIQATDELRNSVQTTVATNNHYPGLKEVVEHLCPSKPSGIRGFFTRAAKKVSDIAGTVENSDRATPFERSAAKITKAILDQKPKLDSKNPDEQLKAMEDILNTEVEDGLTLRDALDKIKEYGPAVAIVLKPVLAAAGMNPVTAGLVISGLAISRLVALGYDAAPDLWKAMTAENKDDANKALKSAIDEAREGATAIYSLSPYSFFVNFIAVKALDEALESAQPEKVEEAQKQLEKVQKKIREIEEREAQRESKEDLLEELLSYQEINTLLTKAFRKTTGNPLIDVLLRQLLLRGFGTDVLKSVGGAFVEGGSDPRSQFSRVTRIAGGRSAMAYVAAMLIGKPRTPEIR